MAIRAILAFAVTVVVAGAAVYAWALHDGRSEITEAATQLQEQLGPEGSLSYGDISVDPLSLSADISDVAVRFQTGELITAASVHVIRGWSGQVNFLHFSGLRGSGAAIAGTATARSLDFRKLQLPTVLPGQSLDPANVRFADAVLRDLTFSTQGTSFTVSDTEITQYGPGQSSKLLIAGLSAAVPNTYRIDRIGLSSLSLEGVDVATAVNAAEHHLDSKNLALGQVHVDLTGLQALGGEVRMFSIKQASMSNNIAADGVSYDSHMDLSGCTVRLRNPAFMDNLPLLGMDEVNGSVSATTSYRAAGGGLTFRPSIRFADLGTLAIEVQITGLDLLTFGDGTDFTVDSSTINRASLVSAKVSFLDNGLMAHIFDVDAKVRGITVEQAREEARRSIKSSPVFRAIAGGAGIRAAWLSFLDGGKTLTMVLHPAGEIQFSELPRALESAMESDPDSAILRLGFKLQSD